MSRPSLQSIGDASFARSELVSVELFALTYGSFVRQLLLDYEQAEDVNKQLEQIGYKMGVRLVDDFLAKSRISQCTSFTETADVMAKVAFKMFLGVSAVAGNWSNDRKTFSLIFDENPLAEFAELPEEHPTLWYSNVVCGVIRGALEMVNMKVSSSFVKCKLRGDDQNEVRVSLHEILVEQVSNVLLFIPWFAFFFLFSFCFHSRLFHIVASFLMHAWSNLTPRVMIVFCPACGVVDESRHKVTIKTKNISTWVVCFTLFTPPCVCSADSTHVTSDILTK